MPIKITSKAKTTYSKTTADFERFRDLTRQLVSVPKKDIQEQEKKDNERKVSRPKENAR